jgi:hypothetical protein
MMKDMCGINHQALKGRHKTTTGAARRSTQNGCSPSFNPEWVQPVVQPRMGEAAAKLYHRASPYDNLYSALSGLCDNTYLSAYFMNRYSPFLKT